MEKLTYLTETPVNENSLSKYYKFGKKQAQEIKALAKTLKNKRVVHINATSVGGGVSEILKSLVGLERSLGIKSRWFTLNADQNFFQITKKAHNLLQGEKNSLTENDKKHYLFWNKRYANELKKLKADIYVLHDPQPMASACHFKKENKISIIHIDMSAPHKPALDFFIPFLNCFKKIVFSLPDYIPPQLVNKKNINIIPPAIDPLTIKNEKMSIDTAKNIILRTGINPLKPLIAQISRFDHWKDPLGVINGYYIAKNKIPDLQLALVGFTQAKDDPEAEFIFEKVKKEARSDPNIFLFSDLSVIEKEGFSNEMFVSAIQTASDIVIQKSIREGFGLTATEAMWKAKPLIAGNVGGLRLQVQHQKNGILVGCPEEMAKMIVFLLENKPIMKKLGVAAKKSVAQNYLITRYLRDYLKMYKDLLAD